MNLRRLSLIATVGIVVCLTGVAQLSWAAFDAYLTIEGVKQGKFKGASAGKIAISDFSFSKVAPQDRATGMAAGKRMHSAITIRKEIDQASPQLMQAMRTGEVLRSVDIEFVHPGPHGPEVYKSMHLTNAVISSIESATGGAGAGKAELITFTAETENIEVKGKDGGKTMMDDWLAK